MRILILNYEFPPLGGGAGDVSYQIAKGYLKLGHSVDVITTGYSNLPSYEKKEGINIYRLSCFRKKIERGRIFEMILYLFLSKRFLKKHLKENYYDINHTHFIIPTGFISLWLKKKYNIPYIITVHGSDLPGYNPDRFLLSHLFTPFFIKRISFNAKKIISPSRYLSLILEKMEIKNIVIRNGIDPESFSPLKKEKIILSTGRLVKRKGFQYLIEAFSDKVGYQIDICGDGPMRKKLEKMAQRSKTKIVFHGWIKKDSLQYRTLLGKASIYCILSSNENASISLLEAMSSGCAIISSNCSGCREMVEDTGVQVNPKNLLEIREGLRKVEGKEEYYGNKARKRVIEKYNWDRIIKDYESIAHN